MDILILIGGFAVFCLLGMPVAYALGLAAISAALWIDLPLEAVMLKVSDGTDDFALLAIPFFILAGAIMGEGGMAERLVNLAKIFVGNEWTPDDVVQEMRKQVRATVASQ